MRTSVLFCLIILSLGCRAQEAQPVQATDERVATFALGCYWCAQHAFDGVDGVVRVTAGHAGKGPERREAVEVVYDGDLISYESLLDLFWMNIDPEDADGQFCDRGSNYRSGIFVHDEEQFALASASRQKIEMQEEISVATEILESGTFEPVRESEQYYYDKHPVRYRFYRTNCGRDARLQKLWGDRAGGKVAH